MESKDAQGNKKETFSTKLGDKRMVIPGISLLILFSLSFILFALQASSASQFFSIIGLSLSIAGAALLVGALLGFLFGIPRSLQQMNEANNLEIPERHDGNDSKSGLSYRPNTNLEQISDWLTKILVGVGLTQISSIPGALKTYADFSAPGLGNFDGSRVFSIGMLGSFLITGFLVGFVATKRYMPKIFAEGDLGAALRTVTADVKATIDRVSQLEQQRVLDAKALVITQRQLNAEPDEERPTQNEIDEAIARASSGTRSQIFYQAEDIRWPNWRDNKAEMEKAIPIFRALVASDTQNKYHPNHGRLAYALKDQREPDWAESRQEIDKAISIRGPARDARDLYYELVRAQCLINLDREFSDEKKSKANNKQAILNDIKAAIQNPDIVNVIRNNDDSIMRWFHTNDIELSKILLK